MGCIRHDMGEAMTTVVVPSIVMKLGDMVYDFTFQTIKIVWV